MDFYVTVFFLISIPLGLYIAFRQKKAPEVRYSLLDKCSAGLNIVLTLVYGFFCIFPVFLAMIIYPTSHANLFQRLIGYLISALIGAAPVYCALALGFSAALRRKGRSKAGFFLQFAGIPGILIPIVIACLLDYVSVDWLNTSLN